MRTPLALPKQLTSTRRASLFSLGVAALAAILTVSSSIPLEASAAGQPSITLSPSSGVVGTQVTVSGQNFPRRSTGQITWDGSASGMPAISVNSNGTFRTTLTVPSVSQATYSVSASAGASSAVAPFAVTATSAVTTTPTATTTAVASPTTTATATSTPTASVTVTASATPTVTPPSTASVTVTIDRSTSVGTSQLAMGVTHTQYSADSWNNTTAVSSARQLLQASTIYQNQHIMGWGADNPEPSPGVYSWSSLDGRVDLIRQTGGTPVITLCCAPDWMKGGTAGTTDWSKIEVAPTPDHYADYAALAQQVALRYPDVTYFQVWNEMKGFWNSSLNRWNYEGYTQLYNAVYDAVKSVRPTAKIGGPYVVIDSWSSSSVASNPSTVTGPYGVLDQRSLDVITYWLANKHGADFVAVDASTQNKDGVQPTDEFSATQKFVDTDNWIHQHTSLPVWWSEWYPTPWGSTEWDHNHQNAVEATTLMRMITSGAVVQLRWQPQGVSTSSYQGDTESIWSDTRVTGGGQSFPYYNTQKGLHDFFAPGTTYFKTTSTSSSVDALASATNTLLVNHSPSSVTVDVNGSVVTLAGYEVRIL